MMTTRVRGLALALPLVALLSQAATAQQTESASGNGLLGNYFNFPEGNANPPFAAGVPELSIPPAGYFPGGPGATIAPEALFLTRLDATVNFQDFTTTANTPTGVNADKQDWGVVWDGFITIPATGAGTYSFGIGTDDGGRLWVNQNPMTTTPDIDNWILEGINGNPGGNKQSGNFTFTAGQVVPIRFEMCQHDGGVGAQLWWKTPASGGAYVIIPAFTAAGGGLTSPVPCGAPVLSAQTVPGSLEIDLTWTAPTTGVAPTAYNIFRATTTKTEGIIPIGTVSGTTLTYQDTANLVFGTQYFYIVQATAYGGLLIGAPSNEVSCAPNPLGTSPNSLLLVENGGVGVITVMSSVAIPVGTAITIPVAVQNTTSGGPSFTVSSAGVPAGTNINVVMNGTGVAGQTLTINVTGVDDQIANDPQVANINLGPTNSVPAGFGGLTFPAIVATQIESDFANVLLTPSGGLSTTNGGSAVTFTVQLSSIPSANVVLNLSTSIPYEAVATGPGGLSTLTFTAGNWNVPQTVTVTPQTVDLQTTYVSSYYVRFTPVQSTDPNYNGILTNSELIFEPTSLPPLQHVWKNCGLTGIEGILLLGFLSGWRRRRRQS